MDMSSADKSKLHTRSPQSLLADSIETYMSRVGDDRTGDTVRMFFRRHVLDLEQLLATVYSTFQAAIAGSRQGADISDWVLEANRVFIVSCFSVVMLTNRSLSVLRPAGAKARRHCTTLTGGSRLWNYGQQQTRSLTSWKPFTTRRSNSSRTVHAGWDQ